MSTKYIASNWRLPNQENSSKNDNYGLTFNGSNEEINCGNLTSLNSLSAFSTSTWINYSGTPTGYSHVFLSGGVSIADRFYIELISSTQIRYGSGSAFDDVTITSINSGEWHHLVSVHNNTSLDIYLDGVKQNASPVTVNAPTSSIGNDFMIGNFTLQTTYDWNGSISELAVFDYALSATQISTLYGSSSLGAGNPMALKPQPVAYYPLGDNSASDPLTQPNVAVEDASVFDFDGSSDSISCDFTNTSNTGSISVWVSPTDYSTGQQVVWCFNGSGYRDYIGLFQTSSGVISFETADNGVNKWRVATTSSAVTNGVWTHLLCTFDSSNAIIYVNGVEVPQSYTHTSDITYWWNDLTPTNYRLGILQVSGYSTGQFYNGKINNTQLWNTALSSTEVETLYNSGVPLYTGTQPQAANLKAWYKLNNTANWEADSAGNWQIPEATSAYPQSFDFDGSTDYINAGNPTSLQITGALTISAWVKFTGSDMALVTKANTSGTDRSYGLWANRFGAPLQPVFFVYNSGTIYETPATGSSANDGNWHHLVGVFNPSTSLQLYIDGVLEQENTTSIPATIDNDNVDFNIGRAANGTFYYNGQCSNVQIWDSALSATGTDSVETLYNNGSPLTTAIASSNLKAWYKLDNSATFSTNWSVPDASGNGNTGTSLGMTEQNLVNNNVSALNGESSGMTSANLVTSDLSRAIPYGDGYSFNFDTASSDYIDLGSPSALDFETGEMTLSCWINSETVSSIKPILGNSNSGASSYQYLLDVNRTAAKISFLTSGVSTLTSNLTISANTWYHICLTRSGTTSNWVYTMYINGSSSDGATASTSTNPPATQTISIGKYGALGGYYFQGKISNFCAFNEALTSTEVLKLYANGVPQDLSSFTPQPVAWYPLGSNSFWNGSAWTCRDMIGSNDGTGQNIGVDGLVGDAPRSEANGTGSNMDVPSNLIGEGGQNSNNNSWSVNMSSLARVEDVA